jgi:hypothetical protein
MRTSLTRFGTCVSFTAVWVLAAAVHPVAAQASRSAEAAKRLAQTLDASKLEAIAAADPADPQSFVAALYFQGSQLLLVSAKYAAPPLLVAKIKEQNYRDVYIDLSSASVAGSKVFVIDAGVDGLASKPGDNGADSYEQGPKQVQFDGDWKKAKLTEEEYMKAYSEADTRYTRWLGLLQAQATAGKGGS